MKKEFGRLHQAIDPTILTIDIFLILIVVLSCLIIFFKTKEIYKLTEHKGIKYFRKGFLFIGFSHTLLLFTLINKQNIILNSSIHPKIFLLTIGIFGLIGLTYLFSSLFAKKIKEIYIYLSIIAIATITIIPHTKFILLFYVSILILTIGIISILKLKQGNKKYFSQIYLIYISIFTIWIITIINQFILDLGRYTPTINNSIKAIIFLYILYLILEKLQMKPKKEVKNKTKKIKNKPNKKTSK